MNVKQYTIKVFEIMVDDEAGFLAFVEKNEVLLRRHLLLLKGDVSPEIETFLQKKEIAFTKNIPTTSSKKESQGFTKKSGLEILDKMVRSGQEIATQKDLLALKRINSGATIKTEGNLIALSTVEGAIECNGDFMLLKPSKKSYIKFNGADISQEMEADIFYKIYLKQDEIIISPYKGVISWA
ncbi:hypothetical protein [Hydrogenimonas sp.]